MKALVALSLLLLVCSVRAQECPDAADVLAGIPNVGNIATLIKDFKLLPYGVPAGATIFLPDNDAVNGLVATLAPYLGGANLTVAELVSTVKASPIASLAMPKLTSALLYHFALGAAWTPEELEAAGTIPTALEGFDLTVGADSSTGRYTITDAVGQVANVLGDPISACGSELYITDKMLMPADLLSIPETAPEDVAAILASAVPPQEGSPSPPIPAVPSPPPTSPQPAQPTVSPKPSIPPPSKEGVSKQADGGGSNIGVIVGAVVGIVAVALAAMITLVVVRRKRKRRALLEKDGLEKDEPFVPKELDSIIKAEPGQLVVPGPQHAQPTTALPALWVAPVMLGSQPPSPPVTLPGSDHAGSAVDSLTVSSFTVAAASDAAAGPAAVWAGGSAHCSWPNSSHGSILHSPTNFDPQNDALLTWVQRQAPAAAQGTTSFPGSEGQASVPESKGSGGLVDISAWKLNFFDLKIIQPLGEGSFGRVYLARYFETLVAAKVLLSCGERELEAQAAANLLSLSSPILAALNKEASLLASLRHPNVVQFIGVTTFPPAIITEFCSRGSLADVLGAARSSPDVARELTWPRRLAMALDAVLGMLYLHSRPQPIIHRDLKSPNLLVEESWRVKVSDLNLSRLLESANVGSQSSSLAAMNPRWLAPEVMQGGRPEPAADVYSFGVVLWEILTFDVPWSSNSPSCFNPWQLVGLVLNGGRLEIPPRESLPGADTPRFQGLDEYVALMRRCWAQQPLDRPSFDHVAVDLRSLLDRTVQEMRTLPLTSSSQPPQPSH